MTGLNVLISGAGIGGPVLAFWLLKAGVTVTIVERDESLRTTGQSIDIRQSAVEVVKMMGLEPEIRANNTTEKAIGFIDGAGTIRALFEQTGSEEIQGFTSEYEVLRGDLARIFIEATKERARYMFGDEITGIEQHGDKVDVTFSKAPKQSYDLVVAADGLGSKLRRIAFDVTDRANIRSFNAFFAWFTVPEDRLGDGIARWYNAPGRRLILLRPDRIGRNHAILGKITHGDRAPVDKLIEVQKQGQQALKDHLEAMFKDAGWLAPQLLKALRDSDDVYGSEIAQVQMDKLYTGRVALVGDAGYAPSPLSGRGATAAIVGAYVLAGELMASQHDVPAALTRYQEVIGPFAKGCQFVPPGAPWIVNPETAWGINMSLSIMGWLKWLGVDKLMNLIMSTTFLEGGGTFKLPNYDWPI